MKITIVSTQKIKQDFYKKAVDEYKKRLSRYCKLTVSSSISSSLLKKEDTLTFFLREDKKTPSSEELSLLLSNYCVSGISHFMFFMDEAPEGAVPLSLSQLPLSNGLKTILLLEQLYRSFRIRNNEPYHK